jgi:hypothetical protein
MKEVRFMPAVLPIVDIRCRFISVRRDPLFVTPSDRKSMS